MKIAGLTGGIASGKTTLVNVIRQLGYYVIEVDEVCRYVMRPFTECTKKVLTAFPSVTHEHHWIDRSALAEIIFSDKEKRKMLEDIVHPYVNQEVNKMIDICRLGEEKIIFYSNALLYEHNHQDICDEVWCCYCNTEVQLQRLMHRDNIELQDAKLRLSAQMRPSIKADKADVVFDTTFPISEGILKDKAERYIERILNEANTH